MKLLTHNMLTSKCIKGVNVGYPLAIVAKDVRVSELEFNQEFIARMITKIDWNALYSAADGLGHAMELPKALVDDYETNEDFLKKVHHVLLEVEVINGELVCPETGRRFPIAAGIPNMLLNEDESLPFGEIVKFLPDRWSQLTCYLRALVSLNDQLQLAIDNSDIDEILCQVRCCSQINTGVKRPSPN